MRLCWQTHRCISVRRVSLESSKAALVCISSCKTQNERHPLEICDWITTLELGG